MNTFKSFYLLMISLSIATSTFAEIEIRCPKDLDLGINPAFIPRPDIDAIKVKTNCRNRGVTVKHVDDIYVYDGCKVIIERIYSAVNRCNEREECTQIIVFVKDDFPPIVPCGDTIDLGCNPDLDRIPDPNPDDIWPPDECGNQNGEHVMDKLYKDGCKRFLERIYRKFDQSGHYMDCVITWCWVEDKKEPKIVKCPKDVHLGCNPDLSDGLPLPTKDDYKKLKVVDDCDVTVDYEDSFSI